MANLKGIIYISNEDYELLVSTGSVVINGTTLNYDENILYLTPDIPVEPTKWYRHKLRLESASSDTIGFLYLVSPDAEQYTEFSQILDENGQAKFAATRFHDSENAHYFVSGYYMDLTTNHLVVPTISKALTYSEFSSLQISEDNVLPLN